jgi:acetyl-CoA C-acetyltransferase
MASTPATRLLRNARVLAPVVAQTARATASQLVSRLRPPAPGEPALLPEPDGVAGFARQVHAQRMVGASPADVADLVADLDRAHEWLTLHVSWRGERPSRMEVGAEFVQQIKLMDIPAQARWRVERADDGGFELRGTGPMGITVGLWCSLAGTAGGTAVRLDGALDGPPVKGPVGLTAVRSVEVALTESLDVLAAILEGDDSRARIADEPVLHERTGTLLDPSTPVVIGVGQVVQRTPDLTAPLEPAAMAADALRAAAEDAGAAGDLLARADLVYAVPSASWTYANQAGLVAELVGADEAGTVQSSPYGGDGAQLAVNDAAVEVAAGRAHVGGRLDGAVLAAGLGPTPGREGGRLPRHRRHGPRTRPSACGSRPR